MIGEKMQQTSTFRFLLQIFCAGKTVARLTGHFELQPVRASGRGGCHERGAGAFVGDVRRTQEFFLQRRGEQNTLGKFTKFHRTTHCVTLARLERQPVVIQIGSSRLNPACKFEN